jgi:hypothetical protein
MDGSSAYPWNCRTGFKMKFETMRATGKSGSSIHSVVSWL